MFTNLINKTRKVARISKHQASKKGYKHNHNWSKGEKNHLAYTQTFGICLQLPK